jgi:DNA-nicking Smr family endonuclease
MTHMKKKNKKNMKTGPGKIKNKNDIKVLEAGHDFSKSFINNEENEILLNAIDTSFLNQHETCKKNKHGLPIIDTLISGKTKRTNEDPEDTFAKLLESSIQDKPKIRENEKTIHLKISSMPLKNRLKRYPPPEIELDLHGFTSLDAEAKVTTFIQNSKREGYFTIRIIVGKGLHSEFGAVLPDIVEDRLKLLKKSDLVLHFVWDKKKKSKSGAIIVYIKQFDL